MASYGKPEYWDERYVRDPDPFDWYQKWPALKEIFMEYLRYDMPLLMVGAGNSRLSEEMYEEGFRNIQNVDVSAVVVSAMQEKYADKEGLTYRQMNCLDMREFGDGTFGGVCDKGTLDSIMCGEDSTSNVQRYMLEISRVLKPGGIYIVVSYGQPNSRMSYLQKEELGWSVKVHRVLKPVIGIASTLADEKDTHHYVYVCIKGAGGFQGAPPFSAPEETPQ